VVAHLITFCLAKMLSSVALSKELDTGSLLNGFSVSFTCCRVWSKTNLASFLKNRCLPMTYLELASESPLAGISLSFTCSRVWLNIDLLTFSKNYLFSQNQAELAPGNPLNGISVSFTCSRV